MDRERAFKVVLTRELAGVALLVIIGVALIVLAPAKQRRTRHRQLVGTFTLRRNGAANLNV